MEQYEIPVAECYDNIRLCLDNFEVERIFIRGRGSKGGKVQVNENLENRQFDIKEKSNGLSILVDNKEILLFEDEKTWGRKFSLAYERFDDKGVWVCLSTGIDPDDPNLPDVETSFLRSANADYLLEVYFKGKIPLKFHSWWDEDKIWKYWCVDVDKISKECESEK